MAKLSDFLSLVLPFVPGCPEPVALQHIRNTCIDFCMASHVWQQTLEPITTVADTNIYGIDAPLTSDVIEIKHAWYKSTRLKIINGDVRDIKAEFYNSEFPDAHVIKGDPRTLLVDYEQKVFSVSPVPEDAVSKALTIRVALKPTRNTMTVPDFLLTDYEYAITQGAIGRIAEIPAQAFTSTAMALSAKSAYAVERHNAAVRANKTFARSQTSVAQRPFA